MNYYLRKFLTGLALFIVFGVIGVALTGCDKTSKAITSARVFIRMCQDSTIQVAQTRTSDAASTFTITCKAD